MTIKEGCVKIEKFVNFSFWNMQIEDYCIKKCISLNQELFLTKEVISFDIVHLLPTFSEKLPQVL